MRAAGGIVGSLAGMSLVATLIVTFVKTRQDMVRGDLDLGDWFVPFAAITMSLGFTAPSSVCTWGPGGG
ncbi:hypothetical protein SVIOM74S_04530 [Streptomyces violarus]